MPKVCFSKYLNSICEFEQHSNPSCCMRQKLASQPYLFPDILFP